MTVGALISRLLSMPKRRAIGRYFKVLSARLYADYGHSGPFTTLQVESTIRRWRIGAPRYVPYAVAIFCDPDGLPSAVRENVTSLRGEIGAIYFNGTADFSYPDVLGYCAESGGHCAPGDSESGHHGGADVGGGHH